MKKTKVVCTLGPATSSVEKITALLQSGMNVARFNFSHGSQDGHREHMARLRQAMKDTGIEAGVMLDTKGPEMRLGIFGEEKVLLEAGKTFILTTEDIIGDATRASVNHAGLPAEVKSGDKILLSDGLVRLTVIASSASEITTTIDNTGEMSSRKRVAVPGAVLSLPFMSEKDIADIKLGAEENVDFIAASFVQRAEDILAIKDLLKGLQADIQIIAKIENAEGVKNMAEILTVADGFMIARGDLGVEIPAEEVPLIQKEMIALCNEAGKPVITATQMLESMTVNPRPTRAEVSDVANAILDGSDAIMLSGETASGMYPVDAVKTMASIACYTESHLPAKTHWADKQVNVTDAVCHATVQMGNQLQATGIITATESGFTAQMVAKYRPQSLILAVTPHAKTFRRLQLVWGVLPILGVAQKNTDDLTKEAITRSIRQGYIKEEDLVVVTAGVPVGMTGTTNMIQVHIAKTFLESH